MPPIKFNPRVISSQALSRPIIPRAHRRITGISQRGSPWETTQPQTPFYPVIRDLPPKVSASAGKTETSFDELLKSITYSLATTLKPSIHHLHDFLRSYKSNADHWSKYAHRNAEKQYTRNLVCELPGVFNLLLLVWTPGQASPIHDHADSHCLMKILKGELQESRFAIPQKPEGQGRMAETSRLNYGVNNVAYIADNLGLHEISNPHPTDYAVSLHLYTPPNAAMRGCHVFDAETGRSKHVMQCAYDSVYGVVGAEK